MTQAQGHVGTGHAHPPHLAHHFDTPQQQYESSKLGMWAFMMSEVLMFSGLFLAYAVYRFSHPEVFKYASHYMSTYWGAINTIILLVSSFTMTWAVRAAQLGQRKLLIWLLAMTIVCGCVFMYIKVGIGWMPHINEGLGPGIVNIFSDTDQAAQRRQEKLHEIEAEHNLGPQSGRAIAELNEGPPLQEIAVTGSLRTPAGPGPAPEPAEAAAPPSVPTPAYMSKEYVPHSTIVPPAQAAPGLKAAYIHHAQVSFIPQANEIFAYAALPPAEQKHVQIFFSIYFLLTGLHGIHVIIGIGLIAYILFRAFKDDFGPAYFTPVDIVSLYWHLVDMIWIFLFPLLYLIQ